MSTRRSFHGRVPRLDAWRSIQGWLRDRRVARAVLDGSLAGGLLLVTGLLFWFGYRATNEWARSNRESTERRANEVLMLLGTALERDMRGAFTTVLLPFNVMTLQSSSRHELADRFAVAFARFPYVESFFVWRRTDPRTGSAYFFNRADLPPPWDRANEDDDVFPVLVRDDPAAARHVIDEARRTGTRGVPFAAFDVSVEVVPYQAFVHLLYGSRRPDDLASLVGFTVNRQLLRDSYFQDLIQHLHSVTADPSLTIEILDDHGALAARTGPIPSGDPIGRKRFPLLFADPSLLASLAPADRPITWWTAQVGFTADPSILAAERATARTLTALVLAGLVTFGGLVWTIRAARAAAALATAQSEFVSAMSHEMKTPLSLIKLASDTLAHGRYVSPATVPEYGRLLGRETHHLRRLIDNVLCFARLHSSQDQRAFEALDASELVQDSVERFRPLLADLDVEVRVQLPLDALWIRGDRVMLLHLLDNLIDNAAKHGGAGGHLTVSAARDRTRVRLDVADAGKGIAPEEIPRIFDQFYRVTGTRTRGSGLGLALVQRIVADHGGTVSIASTVGAGTTVTVTLPGSSGPSPALAPGSLDRRGPGA